ncbi:MAG TPA: hypothetical protein VFU41_04145 [Gemmatimonadales bacterium]|nr:hypothetical protein [Gemmatimonadales bacterium]
MATFLCSLLSLAALTHAPQEPTATSAPPESLAVLRARLAQDSSDGSAWFALGRVYLELWDAAHRSTHGARADSAGAGAVLDTAEQALGRAAHLLGASGASPAGDSARVLRVAAWNARSLLAWEARGITAGPEAWGPLPTDLKLPPVLEELGENLLRACPTDGVLLTADDADSYAAWYMRFARGLRPDLLVVPLAAWQGDVVFRARLAADLKLGRRGNGDAWLSELAQRRPVCVSMAFDRPPDPRPRVKWATRPLVWVAGPGAGGRDRVPPRDFVFAAVRMALDDHDAWALPALALYARSARATPQLCDALRTFRLITEIPRCRR